MTRLGLTSDASFYLPQSSLIEGQNELIRQLLTLYPFTVFQYYIYVDEDLVLANNGSPDFICACMRH